MKFLPVLFCIGIMLFGAFSLSVPFGWFMVTLIGFLGALAGSIEL